jgi:spore maturation protein CgeB
MRIVLFCHSLISDWNHGNAHFLRGIAAELLARGHRVDVFEPHDGWSMANLLQDGGEEAVRAFCNAYPGLTSSRVDLARLDLEEVLHDADVVLVHEWNDHSTVARIGRHHASAAGRRYVLLFHDTHHRSVSDPAAMAGYDLQHYDGVLAFGDVIRERYVAEGWGRRAWTWHEAADTRMFRPQRAPAPHDGDLAWIGNWGDDERSAEIRDYLVRPVRELGVRANVWGVRYPHAARQELADAGIQYHGWIANYRAPAVFARHRVTVHIPRRPYVEALPGIPTIRVFEALACGIPLVSAWWEDREGLFTPGADFLVARSPREMRRHLAALLADEALANELAAHGLATVRRRHTCAHRVDELLAIVRQVRTPESREVVTV